MIERIIPEIDMNSPEKVIILPFNLFFKTSLRLKINIMRASVENNRPIIGPAIVTTDMKNPVKPPINKPAIGNIVNINPKRLNINPDTSK
jgi:hypothetical protein